MGIIKSLRGKSKKYWGKVKSSKQYIKVAEKVDYYVECGMQIFLTDRWWSVSTFAIPYLVIVIMYDIFKYDTIRIYWRDDVVFAMMLILTEVILKLAYRHRDSKREREKNAKAIRDRFKYNRR